MKIFLVITLFLSLFFSSCKKKEVGPQCPSCVTEIVPTTSDVVIGCEGNFGWGNASISVYDPKNLTVNQQVFQNVNGFNLGDVLQSMIEINGDLYVVMNNSGKIHVIDTSNYTSKGQISGFNSPRYLAGINSTKAYCTDLYSNSIQIVDLVNKTISGTLPTLQWTENIVVHGSFAYVSAPDTNWVYKINTSTDQIVDTLLVGKQPNGLVIDQNQHLWVLCGGGNQEEIPTLMEIDLSTSQTVRSLSFSSIAESPNTLRINSFGNRLFFLNDGLQTMEITETVIPAFKSIPASGATLYGMHIDPNNSDIYLTDVVDYVQQGKVYRYDSLFVGVDTISVGIIPQAIWFK